MGTNRRKYSKRNLPPGVEIVERPGGTKRYRGRWPRVPGEQGNGRYRKGPLRDEAWEAARDASEGRSRYDEAVGDSKPRRGEWTLGRAKDAVLDACKRKQHRDGTLRFYRDHFDRLTRAWPDHAPLRAIRREEIEMFRDAALKGVDPHTGAVRSEKAVSAQTVCHDLQVLSRCFNVASSQGYTGANPVEAVERPVVRRDEPDFFDRSEVLEIVERIRVTKRPKVDGDVDADLVLLLFTTAMRRSEVARLRVCDINFRRRTLRVDGKKRPRTLPIPKQMEPLLERIIAWPEKEYPRVSRGLPPLAGAGPGFRSEWIGEGDERFVLPGRDEKHRVDFVARTFKRWQKSLSEPRLHAHALRHSFTTHLYRCGYSMAFVSALAGHEPESRSAAHRYLHVLAPDRVRGMEALWREPSESVTAAEATL